jgi:hypothetical protein
MTPYELSLYVEAHYERQQAEMKDKLTLVWLGEYYHRTKRLPNLQKELRKITGEEEKPIMTDNEMLQEVKHLNAQFGGAHIKGGA